MHIKNTHKYKITGQYLIMQEEILLFNTTEMHTDKMYQTHAECYKKMLS